MSDLISRKAVIEAADRHTRDDGTLDDDISVILEEVETAFDKEKVTSKLKEKYNYSQKVYVELSLHPEHDDSCLAYWDGMVDAYKEAIEIIEKGGIE